MSKETTKTKADTKAKEKEAPQGTPENPIAVAVAPTPAVDNVGTAGPALTPGQQAGLEPIDAELDAEQAEDREHRTNMQTDHELENALDPVSSDPNPAVTPQAPLTAVATGAPPSDMSGRPAQPSPLLSNAEKEHVKMLRNGLTDAAEKDRKAGNVKPNRIGWRTPQDLGIPGGVVNRIYETGDYPIEREEVPNGQFFPETGKRYRLKSAGKSE